MARERAKAEKYWEHAKKLRTIAHEVRGDCNYNYLLKVAREFEEMAEQAESGAKT